MQGCRTPVSFGIGSIVRSCALVLLVASLAHAETSSDHWAFKAPVTPPVPAVRDSARIANPIDNFVLAKLEAAGLGPSPQADKRTLIRRATFDLIGLPPTPQEVEAFLADTSADAFAKVVDRLLASPHYGERWGRHWLDVARYADDKGYVFMEERAYPWAYTYRDWVIGSLNADLPYDHFLLQQIAADRLATGPDKSSLAAMGFLTLGRRFLNREPDIIDDRIDVVCRGTMALTVGCARCHDHKFDPIPTADYYSLYAIFKNSPEDRNAPALGAIPNSPATVTYEQEHAKRQAAVDQFIAEERKQLADKGIPSDLPIPQLKHHLDRKAIEDLRKLEKAVAELDVTDLAAPPRAMCLTDSSAPQPQRIFLRGNPDAPGAVVPAEFLKVLSGPDRKPFTQGSGRLELARAIASRDNPLTARVMVNRVWLEHFGAGIVRTPSDFGMRADPPTHPELLDWLAVQFMNDGWSLKKLHRLIMLSSAYRQSSDDNSKAESADPLNFLVWRMNRRRLDFEATRDTLLSAGGDLDDQMFGRSVDLIKAPYSHRRTVYGYVERQNLPALFRNFDFASPDATCPRRFTTTVPQQALYFMNSDFVIEQAKAVMRRPEIVSQTAIAERIGALYRVLFQRSPTADETRLGMDFVTHEPDDPKLNAWEKYAQVLLESNELVFVD
jgi:hypothetical protein